LGGVVGGKKPKFGKGLKKSLLKDKSGNVCASLGRGRGSNSGVGKTAITFGPWGERRSARGF